ncbi:segregation/condensation protein A [Tistrella bauzanensis]|uniref:Segregation and condensation protein A n=1 Tax=Tistrella bauzanensis TaxID=657419 RepID=A0ABQ1I9F8_9PROT|nr:ScpA family protein [Tistrella bauzanensis]GGB26968.1 segregation/condensation protein A [Tistrella bauzanensis]
MTDPGIADTAAPGAGRPMQLVLDLDGFEGPIDLLLSLARDQKVDLARISITRLADQYLGFIAAARRMHLELAADYLVMAAWLAYLKSRLLLPDANAPGDEDEPSAEEMAQALAQRLRRLEAMRRAGEALRGRPLLWLDRFPTGGADTPGRIVQRQATDGLGDLIAAYARIAERRFRSVLTVTPSRLMTIDQAIERLQAMLPGLPRRWVPLIALLPALPVSAGASSSAGDDGADELTVAAGQAAAARVRRLERRAALAASFVAVLELARQGQLAMSQARPGARLMIHPDRDATSAPVDGEGPHD